MNTDEHGLREGALTADVHSLGKEGEILMATFTEADVLAGKDISGKMRLRLIVNALRKCS